MIWLIFFVVKFDRSFGRFECLDSELNIIIWLVSFMWVVMVKVLGGGVLC